MPPEPEGFEAWWKQKGRFLHGIDATVEDIARDGWHAALAQAVRVAEQEPVKQVVYKFDLKTGNVQDIVCSCGKQIAKAIRGLGGTGG